MIEILLQLTRGLLIGGASVLLGMSALVLWKYRHPVSQSGRVAKHAMTVAASYALLVVLTAVTQAELLVEDAPATWRLVVLPIAYVLGILGLRHLLIDVARRAERGLTKRATDPRL